MQHKNGSDSNKDRLHEAGAIPLFMMLTFSDKCMQIHRKSEIVCSLYTYQHKKLIQSRDTEDQVSSSAD